ncbi:MAG: hypothetical protein ACK4L4_00465 [Gemmobacter sp.]
MLIGIVGFGILSGVLGAAMTLAGFGSVVLAFLAYVVFGSLGAVLFAVAVAQRGGVASDLEDVAPEARQN